MKKYGCWLLVFALALALANPVFGTDVAEEEVSGRGAERPAAMLVVGEELLVAFQEPGSIIAYDEEWNEMRLADLPEGFVPFEMILAGDFLWVLDEEQDVILKMDASSLEVIQSIGEAYPYEFSSLFESNGFALAVDTKGYIYQVEEELPILGLMTGMNTYQAAFFDGYLMYLGGNIQTAGSGVLVKTQEDEFEDEWKLRDDPDTPQAKDGVERIKLLQDGFFYVAYGNTGIVKYDVDGNIYNHIYQRDNEERIFSDIICRPLDGTFYLADRNAGIFQVNWPEDDILLIEDQEEDDWDDWDEWDDWLDWDEWEDEGWDVWIVWEKDAEEEELKGEPRITVRTWKETTTAQVGEERLFGFYRDADSSIRIHINDCNAETLKVKLPLADLIVAREKGYGILNLIWNEESYEFQISEWLLAMKNPEFFAPQYVEIRIDQMGETVDCCYAEWIDEKTKVVRREAIE